MNQVVLNSDFKLLDMKILNSAMISVFLILPLERLEFSTHLTERHGIILQLIRWLIIQAAALIVVLLTMAALTLERL